MIENKHFALLDIQDKIELLRKKWQNLHALAAARKADLEDAIQIHQFFTNAADIEVGTGWSCSQFRFRTYCLLIFDIN